MFRCLLRYGNVNMSYFRSGLACLALATRLASHEIHNNIHPNAGQRDASTVLMILRTIKPRNAALVMTAAVYAVVALR